MVRLEQLIVDNVKNTEHGEIDFPSSCGGGSMQGIYGQNGSGKTAVIDSAECIKTLMMGRSLPSGAVDLLMSGKPSLTIEFDFSLNGVEVFRGEAVRVGYRVSLAERDQALKVVEEALSLQKAGSNKRNLITHRISAVDLQDDPSEAFASSEPRGRWKSILASAKNAAAVFSAAEISSFENGSSFIFSSGFSAALKGFSAAIRQKMDKGIAPKTFAVALHETLQPLETIIDALRGFAQNDFVVINQKHEAVIPLGLMLLSSGQAAKGSKGFVLELDGPSVVGQEQFSSLCSSLRVSNLVLKRLIPGLEVEACKLGDRVLDSGDPGVEFELLSSRDGVKIPLRCESTGVQKVVSILGALIAAYNNSDACIFIDELDSGIFEYLLGELLEVMEPRMKGQLVFTAHNLRPMEKLPLQSIIVTTVNPRKRFMRFRGLHSSNNVRSQYFKSIVLGGQSESVYQPTDKSMIASAFTEAGHPGEKLDFFEMLQRYSREG